MLAVQQHLHAIWERRAYIHSQASAARASSVAGYMFGNAWFVLTPLLEMAVYYLLVVVIFQRRDFGEAPPFVGLMTGLIHFWVFSRVAMVCVGSIVSRRGLLLQVSIQPVVFVATDYVNEVVKSAYYLPLYVLTLLWFGFSPSGPWPLYPFVLLLLLLMSWALGLLMAVVFVFFRDVRNGAQALFRVLLYSCPVVYPLSFVPDQILGLYLLNPVAVMLALVHTTLLGEAAPPLPYVLAALVEVALLLGLAHWLYDAQRRRFTKVL